MKNPEKEKRQAKIKRRKRVRSKIFGTAEIPRLSLYKSNKGLFIQLINDEAGNTLASASDKEVEASGKNKTFVAHEIGKLIAKKALEKDIKKIIFDKGSYKYHGRVKAAADGAREGGLKF